MRQVVNGGAPFLFNANLATGRSLMLMMSPEAQKLASGAAVLALNVNSGAFFRPKNADGGAQISTLSNAAGCGGAAWGCCFRD